MGTPQHSLRFCPLSAPPPPAPSFPLLDSGLSLGLGAPGPPPLLQGWDLPRPHRTSELRLGGPFLPAVDVGAGGGGAVGAEPPIPTPGSECSPPPPKGGGGGRMARSRRFPFFGGGVLGCAGRCLRPGCVGRAVPVCGAVCVCVGGDTPGWGSGGAARGVCGTSWPRGGGRSRGGSHPSARLTALVGGGGRGGGPAAPPQPPIPALRHTAADAHSGGGRGGGG